jgi:hypothetical protein
MRTISVWEAASESSKPRHARVCPAGGSPSTALRAASSRGPACEARYVAYVSTAARLRLARAAAAAWWWTVRP